MSGTVNVARALWDDPTFKDSEMSQREAWIWMIAEASWKDRTKRIGSAEINLKRGQLAASARFLAKAWQWSEPRVRRYFEMLENRRMISRVTDAGVSVITICKYDEYQSAPRVTDAPSTQKPTHHRRTIDANEKKGEIRGKEEDIPPSAGETPLIKPVEVDPVNKATWDLGIIMLAPSGDKAAVKAARSNIGRWLKGRSPVEVLAALNEARKAGTQDPLPYVETVLKNGGAAKPSKPARWIDPATGRGVEQFHPHALDMGNGWWCRPGEEVEWYKNTNELRPDKRTRERQDAEVRAALSGCI